MASNRRECIYVLSHDGIGSLQLPEGRQTISEAPTRLLPLAHENFTREFNFVFCEPMIKLRFDGIEGQCTAVNQTRTESFVIRYTYYTRRGRRRPTYSVNERRKQTEASA